MNTIKTKYFAFVMILMALSINVNCTKAQSLQQSLNSLRGINKAGIIIEKVSQVLNENGLKEDEIRKDAVEKFDFAGIDVLPSSDIYGQPGAPYLYINIGAVKSKENNLYSVNLSVEFRQDVNLTRNPKQIYNGATTWSVSNVGIFSEDKLKDIREFTKSLVDKFIKDYLKANKMEETK